MRNERPPRGQSSDSAEGGRRPFPKRKVCRFCKHKELTIDYKDARALRPYLTERGRIVPRRISGGCAKHQRMIAEAIKRARNLAIIPFTAINI